MRDSSSHDGHAACPWCGAEALGFWERQTLGPLIPKKCHHCSNYVRASWPSVLASIALVVVPFCAAMVVSDRAHLGELAALLVNAAGLAVGGGIAMAWQQRHAHLLRDERRGPQPG